MTLTMTRFMLITLLLLLATLVQADALTMRLVNQHGVAESMHRYIGKDQWVVVNTWSPTCSACIVELPQIKQFIARNPNIPVLGVTLDFPSFGYGRADILQQFLQDNPLDYPLFLADLQQASDLIGRRLVGIPSITIFHPDGRALVTWPGVVEINEIEQYIENYQADSDPLSAGFN